MRLGLKREKGAAGWKSPESRAALSRNSRCSPFILSEDANGEIMTLISSKREGDRPYKRPSSLRRNLQGIRADRTFLQRGRRRGRKKRTITF